MSALERHIAGIQTLVNQTDSGTLQRAIENSPDRTNIFAVVAGHKLNQSGITKFFDALTHIPFELPPTPSYYLKAPSVLEVDFGGN